MRSSKWFESTRLSWYSDVAERARRLDTVTVQSVLPAQVWSCVACRELSAQAASQLAGRPTPTLVVASTLVVWGPLPTEVAPCRLLTMAVRLDADEELNSKSTAVLTSTWYGGDGGRDGGGVTGGGGDGGDAGGGVGGGAGGNGGAHG